ncbi:hypothetical protein OSB04_011685 [Centaurea solstitialis]|uniref:DUF1985 domain-containing protein n=1 Tax=Centaurea solstitialis TaxID=347529 RepID=A0AA38TN12_9ASTR|nr:hypothetical protein OSB04_011685 [Centaurea solstitialis]
MFLGLVKENYADKNRMDVAAYEFLTKEGEILRPSLTARSKVSYCALIRNRLTHQAQLIFRNTPFGSWLDLQMEYGDAMLVTCFLQQEVSVDGAGPKELHYLVGGNVRRFGREEFMLITGLPFGLLPNHSYVYGNALISRLFSNSVPTRCSQSQVFRVKINDVVKKWNDEFDRLADIDRVRVALIIMVELVFLGRQPHQYVSPEVVRVVEDLDRLSEYPWGSFVWSFTYNHMRGVFRRWQEVSSKISLSGFLLAFNIWILEMFPVSSRCYIRKERYPRGIRWERRIKMLQQQDVDRLLRVPNRRRERPHEILVADALELQQDWYIRSLEWLQNPLSVLPAKKTRDSVPRGQRADDGEGPSHRYAGDDPRDPIGWDVYRHRWEDLDTIKGDLQNVTTEQKKQREDIYRLTREIEQIKMSGRHSYSAPAHPPPFVYGSAPVHYSSHVSYPYKYHSRLSYGQQEIKDDQQEIQDDQPEFEDDQPEAESSASESHHVEPEI